VADASTPGPEDQVRALYEQAESRTGQAFEELVSKPSFGVLLARSAENVAAIARIGSDLADLVLRNLRLAGRADVTRLARQLHRTEDKLERLLQEVEELRDELARGSSADASPGTGTGTKSKRTRKAPASKRTRKAS
jgi:hypothetical protein